MKNTKKSILSIIRRHKVDKKVALVFGNESLKYDELLNLVEEYAEKFCFLGIKKGVSVLTVLPNGIQMTITMLALADIGAILVPLNPKYKKHQILKAAITSKAKFIVHEGKIPIFSEVKAVDLGRLQDFGRLSYSPSESEDAPYILTMTSGSTGDPKPIIFSQATKINRALSASKLYDLHPYDSILCGTPQYHSLGQRLTLLPLLLGGTCVLLKEFEPHSWISNIREYSVTFTIGVSSQLTALLPLLEQQNQDFKSLKRIVSSSSSLDKEVKEKLIELLPCHFHECYGASEVGTVTDFDIITYKEKLASVGRAVPDAEIVIRGVNDEALGNYEVGEITVKSTTAFLGYFEKAELTGRVVKAGYFYTGDLGFLDDDGFLYFKGRKKEIIISGGINIYPEDVENIVNNFEGIQESAVFPVPSEKLGELIAAVFVADHKIEINELRSYCMKYLASHQVPIFFRQVNELPKTPLGKIQRKHCLSLYEDIFVSKINALNI